MEYNQILAKRIQELCIAYAFDMTLAEFLDFPEINDYEFVESECTTLLKDSER